MNFIIPIVTFILGSLLESVFRVWDRLTPEIRLYTTFDTKSIPSKSEIRYNTFSLIKLSNRSRRSKATNVHLTVTLPTFSAPAIGKLTTTEDLSSISITNPVPDQIELRAPRLAPRSTIEFPVWYDSLFPGEPSFQGSCDQTVIISEDRLKREQRKATRLMYLILACSLAVTWLTIFIGYFHASHPSQVTLNAPATVPAIPRITIRDPNSILVTQPTDADATVIERADTRTGPYEVYLIPLHRSQKTATIHLSEPHSSFWLRAYSRNQFGRSPSSEPINVPASHSARTND